MSGTCASAVTKNGTHKAPVRDAAGSVLYAGENHSGRRGRKGSRMHLLAGHHLELVIVMRLEMRLVRRVRVLLARRVGQAQRQLSEGGIRMEDMMIQGMEMGMRRAEAGQGEEVWTGTSRGRHRPRRAGHLAPARRIRLHLHLPLRERPSVCSVQRTGTNTDDKFTHMIPRTDPTKAAATATDIDRTLCILAIHTTGSTATTPYVRSIGHRRYSVVGRYSHTGQDHPLHRHTTLYGLLCLL